MEKNKKVAVVTGASGAIGSALVDVLVKKGVFVVKVDIKSDYSCDFRDLKSVMRVAKRISKEYPIIDYLINVSGIGIYKPIEELSIEEWVDSLSVNLSAPMILIKTLIGNLRLSGTGVVVNIGSGMGIYPEANRAAYCSSKFGLRGLSLSLSKELAGTGISVCLLTLGSVMTPFGTGGILKRKQLESKGKIYLEVETVIRKLIKILDSARRESEYLLYPSGYP